MWPALREPKQSYAPPTSDDARFVLILFTDLTTIKKWRLLLKKGFMHCYAMVHFPYGCDVWVDSLSVGLDLDVTNHVTVSELRSILGPHLKILKVPYWQDQPNAQKQFCTDFLTCVALTKRLVGCKSPFVQTPYQLYQHLIRGGAYEFN